jgi:hypothetical protein
MRRTVFGEFASPKLGSKRVYCLLFGLAFILPNNYCIIRRCWPNGDRFEKLIRNKQFPYIDTVYFEKSVREQLVLSVNSVRSTGVYIHSDVIYGISSSVMSVHFKKTPGEEWTYLNWLVAGKIQLLHRKMTSYNWWRTFFTLWNNMGQNVRWCGRCVWYWYITQRWMVVLYDISIPSARVNMPKKKALMYSGYGMWHPL